MQAAYYRLGLPPLSVTHLAFSDEGLRFNNAVADALQQGRFRSEEPLVEFLLELQTR